MANEQYPRNRRPHGYQHLGNVYRSTAPLMTRQKTRVPAGTLLVAASRHGKNYRMVTRSGFAVVLPAKAVGGLDSLELVEQGRWNEHCHADPFLSYDVHTGHRTFHAVYLHEARRRSALGGSEQVKTVYGPARYLSQLQFRRLMPGDTVYAVFPQRRADGQDARPSMLAFDLFAVLSDSERQHRRFIVTVPLGLSYTFQHGGRFEATAAHYCELPSTALVYPTCAFAHPNHRVR